MKKCFPLKCVLALNCHAENERVCDRVCRSEDEPGWWSPKWDETGAKAFLVRCMHTMCIDVHICSKVED